MDQGSNVGSGIPAIRASMSRFYLIAAVQAPGSVATENAEIKIQQTQFSR